MTAYCLFDNVEVLDPEALRLYAEEVREVVERYGGRYLAVGGKVDDVEGDQLLHNPVLIEFPSLAAARRWYDAPDYQDLKARRHSAVRCNASFFGT